MNTINKAVLPGLCAVAVCLGVNSQNAAWSAETTGAVSAGNTVLPGAVESSTNASEGLRFHFKGVPLPDVLTYLSKEAGFVVYLRPGVSVNGTLDAWSEQPVSKDQAVNFLKHVLADHDLSVLQDGRTLTVLRTSDMPFESPVVLGANPDNIPKSPDIVTQIIPVRSLNPVELGRVLQPLLPTTSKLVVNESANSLLLTDSQANVHRVAEIIAALDSVSATANTLKTYPLKYADAKELSGLIKELFGAADNGRGNGNSTAPVFNVPGRRGGPGAFNPFNGNAGADNGSTPQARVAATADEHGNVVIVSAPAALLSDIDHLVSTLDVPVEDTAITQVFPLQNADCTEMADVVSRLFPDDANSSDASRTPFQLNGQGIRGAQGSGARQGTTGTTGESSRMQKLGRVLVVPDPRTSSLVVSAAQSLMPSVREIIERLDGIKAGHQQTYVIPIQYASLWEVQQLIQSLYPSASNATTSATTTDPLEQRRQAIFTSMFGGGSGSVAANSSGNAFSRSAGTSGRTAGQ